MEMYNNSWNVIDELVDEHVQYWTSGDNIHDIVVEATYYPDEVYFIMTKERGVGEMPEVTYELLDVFNDTPFKREETGFVIAVQLCEEMQETSKAIVLYKPIKDIKDREFAPILTQMRRISDKVHRILNA